MGYTHYWSLPSGDPRYAMRWPGIVEDARRIVRAVRDLGVVIAGPDGYRRPVLDVSGCIAFNGDATTDLDYEPFALAAPGFGGPPRSEFCKTGRRPYDVAVTAVLLRCHLLLPDVFLIGSDGHWDHEWLTSAIPDSDGPGRGIGARRLLADLFDAIPPDNPFTTDSSRRADQPAGHTGGSPDGVTGGCLRSDR
jgi:hypothetical protein